MAATVPEFTIERDEEADVFVASWNDPAGGGITAQAKDLKELASAIEEAVRCHFAGRTAPRLRHCKAFYARLD